MQHTKTDILGYICALAGVMLLLETHYVIWVARPIPYFIVTTLVAIAALAGILVITRTTKIWRARITGLCAVLSLLAVLYLAYDATQPVHGANIGLGFVIMALFHTTGLTALSLALPAHKSNTH